MQSPLVLVDQAWLEFDQTWSAWEARFARFVVWDAAL